MAKRKQTDAEVLEQYRTTPQQHATEYLKHATHDYSAHNILRLATASEAHSYELHETFSKHEIALKFDSFVIRVRTPQRIGRTEITVTTGDKLAQVTANLEVPFTAVARMVAELIDAFSTQRHAPNSDELT